MNTNDEIIVDFGEYFNELSTLVAEIENRDESNFTAIEQLITRLEEATDSLNVLIENGGTCIDELQSLLITFKIMLTQELYGDSGPSVLPMNPCFQILTNRASKVANFRGNVNRIA